MPVQRCQRDGKSGWRWGRRGFCYTGPGAKAKAARQGAAIRAAGGEKVEEPSERLKSYSGHIVGPETRLKFDDELQIVWGEVYVPDIPDSQGDFMTADEIRKMAHRFMAQGRTKKVDRNHDNRQHGSVVVESFVVPEGHPEFPILGAWVIGVHIPDAQVWEAVKSGEFNGFSMQVTALREEKKISVEIPEAVAGDTDQVNGHRHSFKVEFDENGNFMGGRTTVEDGHFHTISRPTVTEAGGTDPHTHRFSFLEQVIGDAPGR